MRGARKTVKTHTTIIKRSSKKGHEAHHGGAWKVAFADFTLAMMALFMVLWIVNSVSQQEREEIIGLLNGYTIFDGNLFSPINSFGEATSIGGGHILPGGGKPLTMGNVELVNNMSPDIEDEMDTEASGGQYGNGQGGNANYQMEDLARIIYQITQTYKAEANLKLEIVPQGLRILIQDDKAREMFQRGSATLTPFFQKLLLELVPVFKSIDNSLIITGHTDAVRYRDPGQYNNWNLSGDRALVARRALVLGGLDANKVLQVNSMADRMLLDANDPTGAQNRRIEIMVLTKSAEDMIYKFFGYQGNNVVKQVSENMHKGDVNNRQLNVPRK